jgi:D-3-phosphoglycerate dehydrogenase / 2-oxoglutarate reductase
VTQAEVVRVLVVGDPYMPTTAYTEALACLGDDVTVSSLQIDAATAAPPRTESEHRLREYVGDPAEIARAVAGHHVLIVHGAPVSSEVLDAAPGVLRSRWPRQCGRDGGHRSRYSGREHAGKER